MEEDELKIVDRFIQDLSVCVRELEAFSGYIRLEEEGEHTRSEALKILRRVEKNIFDAESKKDLKRSIKMGKLIEQNGGYSAENSRRIP